MDWSIEQNMLMDAHGSSFIRDISVSPCTKTLPSQEEAHGIGRGVWQEFLGESKIAI